MRVETSFDGNDKDLNNEPPKRQAEMVTIGPWRSPKPFYLCFYKPNGFIGKNYLTSKFALTVGAYNDPSNTLQFNLSINFLRS